MKRLIVVATGINGSPRKWSPLLKRLGEEADLADSEWLIFHHYGFWNWQAFGNIFTQSVADLSLELKARIEQRWVGAITNGQPYDEIICIGHSVGGLMIRQAYLVAAGAYPKIRKSEISWTDKVSRFVLLASINRGFYPDNWLWRALVNLSRATGFPAIHSMAKGSAFITNLRISWIRYFSHFRGGPMPVMIQVLGTQDGVVKRTDSVDLQAFPNGIQLDVADARHDDLYRQKESGVGAADWDLRYTFLKWAMFQCEPESKDKVPTKLQGIFSFSPEKRKHETATVFIVHGIRDTNSGWAKQLEDQIKSRTDKQVSVVRSSYGYFSALNFFFPWLRRKNIRWFQDQYSYHFAQNPQMVFHFIGHSNGTYLLGESLKQVSAMQFERVYLAGSVLPREYPWQDRFDLDQVKLLRNDRSCADMPVGILCSGLRGIGMSDIGTGGFDGFLFDDGRTEEVCYYAGGHGKPLAKENQASILAFALEGDRTRPAGLLDISQISPKFRFFSRFAPYVMLLLIVIIGIVFVALIFSSLSTHLNEFALWRPLFGAIVLVYIVYALAQTG